jgi:hypothetical protein
MASVRARVAVGRLREGSSKKARCTEADAAVGRRLGTSEVLSESK